MTMWQVYYNCITCEISVIRSLEINLCISTFNYTPIEQLNVMLTGIGGTLTEGQNHILTCEASGGESMPYTYMWLKDGNVVSGQTSSTYSFFPLLAVHSGQYSCRVSVGSMTVTSESVDITVESESGYDHT